MNVQLNEVANPSQWSALRFTNEEVPLVMSGRKIQLRVWAKEEEAPWQVGDEVDCIGPDGKVFAKVEILRVTVSTLMGGTVQDLFDEGFLYSEQLIEAFFKTHNDDLRGLLLVDEIAPHPVWVVRFRRLLRGAENGKKVRGVRSLRR